MKRGDGRKAGWMKEGICSVVDFNGGLVKLFSFAIILVVRSEAWAPS